jgi:hypothetical protein
MSQYVYVPGAGWFPPHQQCAVSSPSVGNVFPQVSPQQRLPGHAHAAQNASTQYLQQQQQSQQHPAPVQVQQYQIHQYKPADASFPNPSTISNSAFPYRPGYTQPPSNFQTPNADSIRFFDLVYGWGDRQASLPPQVLSFFNGGAKGPMPDLAAFNAQREANLATPEVPLPNPSIADPSSVLSQIRYDGFNILDTPWRMAGPELAPLPVPEMLPPVSPNLSMDLYRPGLQGIVGQGQRF